ncbi:MAG TPA: DNA-binding transcriptional regulator Fis [Chromatiaceae bacterium]|nr:DNA-binding transcriptional regulator Fis [Chromatiaceae bacterium]HIA08830.1 DNA-binding transcriptional regulator Fis [Chromatiaceae bacterium]HIB85492.1 DNA-binding transcriptional regulator Fis [Chromatiaceae bacterium]HIO53808.1 DNA-binding transcriptional regulator Fis [Chromatiales bacterium]
MRGREPLRDCVRQSIETYFETLSGQSASGLYQMVLAEVEKPLIETVMNHTAGNQTHAADILGLSRGTLRKKLAEHHIT